jgi:ABC-2 type transport system ATP-binding protein
VTGLSHNAAASAPPGGRDGTAKIVAVGLTKRFGRLTAVSKLNLTVGAGEVVGFLGPNGAGKTTTIRMLLGFINPTSGSCAVLGGSLRSDRDFAARRLAARRLPHGQLHDRLG